MQIEAPDSEYLSTAKAAEWIGIGAKLFVHLAEREDWLRPVLFGSGERKLKKWARMDIVCFAWIYHRRYRGE